MRTITSCAKRGSRAGGGFVPGVRSRRAVPGRWRALHLEPRALVPIPRPLEVRSRPCRTLQLRAKRPGIPDPHRGAKISAGGLKPFSLSELECRVNRVAVRNRCSIPPASPGQTPVSCHGEEFEVGRKSGAGIQVCFSRFVLHSSLNLAHEVSITLFAVKTS